MLFADVSRTRSRWYSQEEVWMFFKSMGTFFERILPKGVLAALKISPIIFERITNIFKFSQHLFH
jgi:hypothetical protein